MVRFSMWVNVRLVALSVLAMTSLGCSLVLDTTPPEDAGPPEGECSEDFECSQDACEGIERCEGGQCVVVVDPPDCDDDIDCTEDRCEPSGCVHEPDDSQCSDAGEVCIPAEDGCVTPRSCSISEDCEDYDVCTAPQICSAGHCVIEPGTTDLVCPLPGSDGCAIYACDSDSGCVIDSTDPSLCAAFEDRAACTRTECLGDGSCEDVPEADFCLSADSWLSCEEPVCDPTSGFADAATGCAAIPNDEFCRSANGGSECVESICVTRAVAGVSIDGDGCVDRVVADACGDADMVCSALTGDCTGIVSTVCSGDPSCDDGDPCNGVETCSVLNQSCVAGTPPCGGTLGCEEEFCVADGAGGAGAACVLRPTDACYAISAP